MVTDEIIWRYDKAFAPYGSETWASEFLLNVIQTKDGIKTMKVLEQPTFEKAHNRSAKEFKEYIHLYQIFVYIYM
jgi:hypothetical protein